MIAELIRRDDPPPGTGYHGDLPDEWSASLRHELAAALSCSAQSAETTAWLAWEQQARLPGTGALLADGTLTPAKARAVTETFRYLSDADAARAEALIAGQLAGKTYPQVLRLAEQAALTVDPELAERRREQAQRKDARVTLFREQQGTAGLSGRDLPPDEALAAMAQRERPRPGLRGLRRVRRHPDGRAARLAPTSTCSTASPPRPGSRAPKRRTRPPRPPRPWHGPRPGQPGPPPAAERHR